MIRRSITAAIFFVILACNACANPIVFDIRDYGIKPDGDISEALLSAWKAACNSSTPSKVYIGPGKWKLSQVRLEGPNKAHVELEVRGTLQADVDPSKLPNKKGEWITINYLNYFTLSGGGVFDGRGQEAWKQNDCHKNQNCAKLPINLSFNFIKNAVIRDVTTKDSKIFHVNCIASSNVTFQRFTVSAPGNSPNTDGIHLARSTLVRVVDSVIRTGDDCISIGDQSKDIYVENVTCGPGHGISVGSLGKYESEKDVDGIYVRNCTFLGTDNGVRVKTWPSAPAKLKIRNLQFEDLIMRNVTYPIVIDQEYCPHNLCKKDTPSFIKISDVKLRNIRGTSSSPLAVTFVCSSSNPCENVQVGDIDISYHGNLGNITTECANVKPSLVGKQNPPLCLRKPLPA